MMDTIAPLIEFRDKLFHMHAKDARIDRHRLDQLGITAFPNEYHTPKLPGLGEVDWGKFISVLQDTGYTGAVAVEVEDRATKAPSPTAKPPSCKATRSPAVYGTRS